MTLVQQNSVGGAQDVYRDVLASQPRFGSIEGVELNGRIVSSEQSLDELSMRWRAVHNVLHAAGAGRPHRFDHTSREDG